MLSNRVVGSFVLKKLLLVAALWAAVPVFGKAYVVTYGTHRTVAIVVLVRRGELAPSAVVGQIDGIPLTAGHLTALYASGELQANNSDRNGRPWFQAARVEQMTRHFSLERLFDPHYDFGVGVVLASEQPARPEFSETTDFGRGTTARAFIDANTPEQNACTSGFRYIAEGGSGGK
ncbi:MAG: hypothetical protein KDD51_04915 [Bdellovibrionales bacterium]|nr:hypothetical protein [Bdellovibrionales bacterium]